jgi:hypothetical protein
MFRRKNLRALYLATAVSVLALSACGGGSGSSASPPPVQLPSPTPSPTPTPTPPPAIAYVVPDYSSSFVLNSSLGYLTTFFEDPEHVFVGGSLLPQQSSSRLDYNHDPLRVSYFYDGLSVSFAGADRTTTTPFQLFSNEPQRLALGLNREIPARYITVASWRTGKEVHFGATSAPGGQYRTALFGTPSAAADPLPDYLGYAGLAWLEGGIAGSPSPRRIDIGSGSQNIFWSYTPSNNAIFGSIPLVITENAAQVQRGLLIANGQFDRSTNSMSGTLTDPDSGFRGTFRGQMFGPDRAELAIVFEFSRASDSSAYFGHYIGRR